MSLKLERELAKTKKEVAILNMKYDRLHDIVEHKMVDVFEAIVKENIDIELSRGRDAQATINNLKG